MYPIRFERDQFRYFHRGWNAAREEVGSDEVDNLNVSALLWEDDVKKENREEP